MQQSSWVADLDDMISQLRGAVITWCAFVLASGLLGGCGGGTGSSSPPASQSNAPITKARASTYARAVNLRTADVTGLESFGSQEREAPAPKRSAVEFARCFGGPSPTRTVIATESPQFGSPRAVPARRAQFEESRVSVWPTPRLAARNDAAYESPRGRACFLRFLEASRKQLYGLRHGPPAIATVPISLPGVTQSFLRTEALPLLRGGRVLTHIYHDVFTFVSGPAEVELESTGFSHPVPTATDERLLSRLLSRATENKL